MAIPTLVWWSSKSRKAKPLHRKPGRMVAGTNVRKSRKGCDETA